MVRDGAWTQAVHARDINGNKVPANSTRAVCWCILGHLEAGIGPVGQNKAACLIHAIMMKLLGGDSVSGFNDDDTRTKEEVAEFLEATARKLE